MDTVRRWNQCLEKVVVDCPLYESFLKEKIDMVLFVNYQDDANNFMHLE